MGMSDKVDVILVTWPGHDFARKALRGLVAWHESLGHSCRFSHLRLKSSEWKEHFGSPDIAYVWNGEYSSASGIVEYLRSSGARLKFVEIGWFPQSKFIYVDDRGTNGNCSLFGSSLSWVDGSHFSAANKLREEHLQNIRWNGVGGYIAVPLQLSSDTQISQFSPIKSMTELMDHCESTFPNDRIMFKKHPKDKSTLGPRCFTGGSLHEWLAGAKLAYGINSTALLEAALMGVPTVTIGKCLLNIHPDQNLVLAALAAKQIPIGESDLSAWTTHPELGLCLD